MALTITHQDDTPLTGVDLTAQRAVPSAPIDLKIKNTGVTPVSGAFLTLYAETTPGSGVYKSSGQPVVDERMGRFQITGQDSTATPGQEIASFLGIQPVGHLAVGLLPTILPGDWILANFWIAQAASSAGGGAINFKVEVANDTAAYPLPRGVSDVGHGIASGRKQAKSFLIVGRKPSASGTPDNFVHIDVGGWLLGGEEYTDASVENLSLNQNDGAAAALAVGESYIAAITQGVAAVPTVTKGLKATTPAKPTPPVGELILAWVTVLYNATATVISTSNIESDLTYGRCRVGVPPTGLSALVEAGEAIIAGYGVVRPVKETITLPASSTSRIWLEWTGAVTVTASDTPPSPGAVKLAIVVTNATDVTSNTDTRTYIADAGFVPGALQVGDGITTVGACSDIEFSGGAVVTNLGGGVAGVAISGGGGGGGGATTFGPFASRPAGSNGDQYWSTDCPVRSVKISGVWQDFYEGIPVTPITFGGLTLIENAGTLHVPEPTSFYVDAARSLNPPNFYAIAAPSTPYVRTMKAIIQFMEAVDNAMIGIGFRQSFNGKTHLLMLIYGSTHWALSSTYCATPGTMTTFYKVDNPIGRQVGGRDGAGSPAATEALIHRNVCLQIADDGTNRSCAYSLDNGVTFLPFNPVTPITHGQDLTPDQVGLVIGNFGAASACAARFISFG